MSSEIETDVFNPLLEKFKEQPFDLDSYAERYKYSRPGLGGRMFENYVREIITDVSKDSPIRQTRRHEWRAKNINVTRARNSRYSVQWDLCTIEKNPHIAFPEDRWGFEIDSLYVYETQDNYNPILVEAKSTRRHSNFRTKELLTFMNSFTKSNSYCLHIRPGFDQSEVEMGAQSDYVKRITIPSAASIRALNKESAKHSRRASIEDLLSSV